MKRDTWVPTVAGLLVGLPLVFFALVTEPPWAHAQQRTDPAPASYTGLVSIDLGDDLNSTGAGTAVEVEWLDTARIQVVFSGADGANDVDIEGSVDGGTTYHQLRDFESGSGANATADAAFEIEGPLTHLRANVNGLGAGITVDINGRATVR